MPHAGGRPPEQQPHRSISTSNGIVRFASGSQVRIVFSQYQIRIGCHVVSREAWQQINSAYLDYLGDKTSRTYQEGGDI